MFDIGWGEFVLIGIIALIAIGPKELPGVLRALGQWMTKIRRMASEFQGQFQEAMREAEMHDLKKEVEQIGDAAHGLSDYNPLEEHNLDGLAKPENKAPAPTPAASTEAPAGSGDEPADAPATAPALPEPDIGLADTPKPSDGGRGA